MSAGSSYKRFPVQRRRACVPVASARARGAGRSVETGRSVPERAVAQANGGGVSPGRSAPVPVEFDYQEDKGVVDK